MRPKPHLRQFLGRSHRDVIAKETSKIAIAAMPVLVRTLRFKGESVPRRIRSWQQ